MADERITAEPTSADTAPIPLTAAAPAAVQKQDAGSGANSRQVRVWLLAIAAFALVFFVVHGLLAPGDTPPAEEVNQSTPATPDRISGNDGVNAPHPPLPPDALFARNSPAVVQVVIRDQQNRTVGTGSGFLVTPTGLIVTNHHVIEKAHSAHVVLADGTKMPVAGVAALDEVADIAIIKVESRIPTQPLELAGYALPPVGVKVYAIGNPLGLSNTLSDGLVSGQREFDHLTVIQTTAPISPGSSGGPLLSADGRVVGVTTFGFKGGQNLNFAIPASYVEKLLRQCEPRPGTISALDSELLYPLRRFPLVQQSTGLAGATAAQGKATGTWKWEVMFKDQKREQTVKLKLEGTKLTGTMPGRKEGTETKIEDGKFENGEVSFTVTRERGDQKFVTKYKGKLEGDTIKGTIESSFGGKDQKRDWEAKRVKDDK